MDKKWVIWDDTTGTISSVVRSLPTRMQDMSDAELAQLGFRTLIESKPEDYIPRFQGLLGSSVFTLQSDGTVLQTYPNADFSVASIKQELKTMAKHDAGRALGVTDWYVVRHAETGQEIPEDIVTLRGRQRDHHQWLIEQIDSLEPRQTVDYRWTYPTDPRQVMVDGVPVIFDTLDVPKQPVVVPEPLPHHLPEDPYPKEPFFQNDKLPEFTDGTVDFTFVGLTEEEVTLFRLPEQAGEINIVPRPEDIVDPAVVDPNNLPDNNEENNA